eukprot:9318884-Pyramimonas_sp.AAC.1
MRGQAASGNVPRDAHAGPAGTADQTGRRDAARTQIARNAQLRARDAAMQASPRGSIPNDPIEA